MLYIYPSISSCAPCCWGRTTWNEIGMSFFQVGKGLCEVWLRHIWQDTIAGIIPRTCWSEKMAGGMDAAAPAAIVVSVTQACYRHTVRTL